MHHTFMQLNFGRVQYNLLSNRAVKLALHSTERVNMSQFRTAAFADVCGVLKVRFWVCFWHMSHRISEFLTVAYGGRRIQLGSTKIRHINTPYRKQHPLQVSTTKLLTFVSGHWRWRSARIVVVMINYVQNDKP